MNTRRPRGERSTAGRDALTASAGARTSPPDRGRPSWRFALLLAVPLMVLELLVLTRWGWFRDELYSMASTEHLAWGYVDHPPLSIALLALVRAAAGPSLVAMRIAAALLGGATVMVLALLARQLGGGRWAMAVAAAALTCSVALFLFHVYSLNALDLLLWASTLLALTRALERPATRHWLVVGLVLGLALLNKLSAVWLGVAILVALLATPQRRLLATRGPWLAALLAVALFTPHVVWQQLHGWPTLEFVANARAHKIAPLSPAGFWAAQLQLIGPVSLILALAGAAHAALRRRHTPLAVNAWIVLLVAAYLTADPYAKPYYLLAALMGGFAVGGVALEALVRSRWRRAWWALPAVALAMQVGFGALMVPVAVPVLPQEQTMRYLARLGIVPSSGERVQAGSLPQHLGDMNGWEELARSVAAVYRELPEGERERTSVYATNYGRAGAVDVLGRRLGLPPAISGHNSYWLWSRIDADSETLVLVGGEREDYAQLFEDVELARVHMHPWAVPGESRVNIFVARGPHRPLAETWPQVKRFI
ncbi:MAG: glycosyltransferase family 39 protein [Candidatus Krumholzibacteriia bacterium]